MDKCEIQRFKKLNMEQELNEKVIKGMMEDIKKEVVNVSKRHNIEFNNSTILINEKEIIIQTDVEVTDRFLDEIREKLLIKKISIKIGGVVSGLVPIVRNWLEIKMKW